MTRRSQRVAKFAGPIETSVALDRLRAAIESTASLGAELDVVYEDLVTCTVAVRLEAGKEGYSMPYTEALQHVANEYALEARGAHSMPLTNLRRGKHIGESRRRIVVPEGAR